MKLGLVVVMVVALLMACGIWAAIMVDAEAKQVDREREWE